MVSVENDGRLALCNYYKISHIWYEVWPSIQGHFGQHEQGDLWSGGSLSLQLIE